MRLVQIGESTWIEPGSVISIEADTVPLFQQSAARNLVRVRTLNRTGGSGAFTMSLSESEIKVFIIDFPSADAAKDGAREIAERVGAEVRPVAIPTTEPTT